MREDVAEREVAHGAGSATPSGGEGPDTSPSDAPERTAVSVSGAGAVLPGLGALAAVATGLLLASRLDRTGVTAGVLLLGVGLALGAVAVGGRRYGPEVEGRLDLGSRLGAGLLGGCLGGLAGALVAWLTLGVALPALAGVSPGVGPFLFTPGAWVLRGGLWGLVLGLLFPVLPGRNGVSRGLLVGLGMALWSLLIGGLPGESDAAGFRGPGWSFLPPLFGVLAHLVWGFVAGRVLVWAAETEDGSIGRPLARS